MGTLDAQIDKVIDRGLAEDLGQGDVTTDALIGIDWQGKASCLVKAAGVLAGVEIAGRVFRKVDPEIEFQVMIPDGTKIASGDIVATVEGRLAGILKAERTALNLLQRLSGIATETARYVSAVGELPVKILDTRKTTPGLRLLEKYAVQKGGGQNHRLDLADGILIKDNHLEALLGHGLGIRDAVTQVREKSPGDLKVEVETKTLDEVRQAVDAGADIIMLDNMDPDTMREAVKLINHRAWVEASGNITLSNIRDAAATGVDFISIGALTHSVRALDISLEFES
jgi:nicotinate-nucleotide pyrophosphorylase (carboxylating)